MSKKVLLCSALIACLLATGAGADQQPGTVEFSVAGSMQTYVFEEVVRQSISLPVRIGIFATPNILFEAEGIFTEYDQWWYGRPKVGYIASLNGSYNFSATEKVMPFILVGFGVSNGLPLMNTVAVPINSYDKSEVTPTLFNAGAGIKLLFTPKAALRVEYRLQDFSSERIQTMSGDGSGSTYDLDITAHSLFFGVSLFF